MRQYALESHRLIGLPRTEEYVRMAKTAAAYALSR